MPHVVRDLRIEPLGDGYMSDVYRVHTGQQTIIVKLSAADPQTHDLAKRFGSYKKEHYFYAELADELTVETPNCFFNLMDSSESFALGIEDLSSGIKSVLTEAEIMQAVTALAHLHRSNCPDDLPQLATGMQAASVDLENVNLSKLFDGRAADILAHYTNHSLDYLPDFLTQPQVFCHMDFRLDNLAFRDDQAVLFDWGEFSMAPAGFDLAYFAVTSLTTQQRRSCEARMLDRYCQENDQLSRQQLDENYRLCLLPVVYLPVLMQQAGRHDAASVLAANLSSAILDFY